MTIAEAREKCKVVLSNIPRDILVISVLVCACIASFSLGYLAGRDVGQGSDTPDESPSVTESTTTGAFVASKTGTKYYTLDCAGASRISPANKIWFPSKDAASRAGYAPAVNCKGL